MLEGNACTTQRRFIVSIFILNPLLYYDRLTPNRRRVLTEEIISKRKFNSAHRSPYSPGGHFLFRFYHHRRAFDLRFSRFPVRPPFDFFRDVEFGRTRSAFTLYRSHGRKPPRRPLSPRISENGFRTDTIGFRDRFRTRVSPNLFCFRTVPVRPVRK